METRDLERYLARVGLPAPPSADADGLHQLQDAQLRSIPFENFDVLLRRGPALALNALVAKLVDRRRGGYCFELNGLFLAALRALGFRARPLLARVLLRGDRADPGPRTHQVNLVEADGRDWIADVGFGVGSPRVPLPLAEGASHSEPGETIRLTRTEPLGWMLQRQDPAGGAGDWIDLYAFELTPVFDVDIAMSNHFTSTYPESIFRAQPMLALATADGRLSMRGDQLTRRVGARAERTTAPAGAARLPWLAETFGIELDVGPDELPPWS